MDKNYCHKVVSMTLTDRPHYFGEEALRADAAGSLAGDCYVEQIYIAGS